MKLTVNIFSTVLLKSLFLAAFFFVLTSFNSYQRLWQPEKVKPFTEWFQINWQGQAVGWSKLSLETGDLYFKVSKEEVFEGRVRGKRLKFSYNSQMFFSKQAPYGLIKGRAESVEPGLLMTTSFENSEQLLITQQRNNVSKDYTEKALEYSLNDFLAMRQFIESKPVNHQTFAHQELEPHSLQLRTAEYQVMAIPQGRHQRYLLSNQSDDSQLPFHITLNLMGQAQKLQKERGIEFITNTQKPSINPEMQRDLYASNGLQVNQPLGDLSQINDLTLRFESGTLDWLNLHETANVDNNMLLLKAGATYKADKKSAENWRFYEPEQQVVGLMTGFLSQQTILKVSPRERVAKLLKFAHDYLYYQPTPASFTTAELIANGYGDCTEYTQLLLALLNAAEVPAREVPGYIYLGDDEQRFGGHEWVEVLLDGQWVGVDPTWNLMATTAGHLPITMNKERSASDLVFAIEQIHYKN